MVTVCMITYNHEKWIAAAIESVMKQKTDFDFDLIIGEDRSTDRTLEICRSFKEKYPDKIQLISTASNVGMQANFIRTLHQCRGKYIAILDGDDYWTDLSKLQKQVDFLEANPAYSICFHQAEIVYAQDIAPFYPDINKHTAETTGLNELIEKNYIHSSTSMLRNIVVAHLPDWFIRVYPGDWPLFVLTAEHGQIRFMKETMGAYRIHDSGVHSTQQGLLRDEKALRFYDCMRLHFKEKNEKVFRHFAKQFTDQEVRLYGFLNLKNSSRFDRFKRIIKSAFQTGNFKNGLRAFVVLFSPDYYIRKNQNNG
jgi:glycosyltransferase involved in cell wall biosynthesis